MNDEHDDKLKDISERIARGDYEIDAAAVADAMLRRPGLVALLRGATFRAAA